jgi:hypothetical protein
MRHFKTSILQSICLIVIIFACVNSSPSQDGVIRVDEASEANCEDISARIDRLASLVNNIGGQGYAVVYLGSDVIKNAFFAYYVDIYKRFRRYDDRIYKTILTQGTDKPKLEFWISKNGDKPGVPEKAISYKLARAPSPIAFVSSLLEIVKIDGKNTYYSVECEACCIESMNWYVLSKFLRENKELKAYFIIRGGGIRRANLLEGLIRSEAEDSDVKRLRFFYAGKNKINSKQFFEVSVFLSSREYNNSKSFPNLIDVDR